MTGRVLGLVLAGGKSSRFGSDKALAFHKARPLIDHAIDRLAECCGIIAVSGRDWNGITSLVDLPAAGLGPLSGINAGLHHAQETGHDWVLSIACDTPFVERGVLADLGAREVPGYLAEHPVIGLWPSQVAQSLDAWLRIPGKHSMRAFAAMIGAQPINTETELANFNYAADFEAWQKLEEAGSQ